MQRRNLLWPRQLSGRRRLAEPQAEEEGGLTPFEAEPNAVEEAERTRLEYERLRKKYGLLTPVRFIFHISLVPCAPRLLGPLCPAAVYISCPTFSARARWLVSAAKLSRCWLHRAVCGCSHPTRPARPRLDPSISSSSSAFGSLAFFCGLSDVGCPCIFAKLELRMLVSLAASRRCSTRDYEALACRGRDPKRTGGHRAPAQNGTKSGLDAVSSHKELAVRVPNPHRARGTFARSLPVTLLLWIPPRRG
ncbi:hypothetical protein DFH08DRAFT_951464 [Mycena albidolilacea]|uniref:Uncharacterized protein n=1 Tax=Mycena albidolilacea TaxID=1033008 RepID=A0AAD7F0V2_9AGAR|nr:hypothetical protein DFH08DRAFT_951464 [Mycena albidolilacea]